MKQFGLLACSIVLPLLLSAKSPTPAHLPADNSLVFVENKGQITDQFALKRPDIQFRLTTPGMTVFVGNGQLHYQWYDQPAIDKAHLRNRKQEIKTYRMDVTLTGANRNAAYVVEHLQSYRESYYTSGDGIVAHAYKKITYKNVYPQIDWVLYIASDPARKTDRLKYDFVVHPGGRPSDIRLQYEGATSLELSADGSIAAATPMGEIHEQAPVSYAVDAQEKTSSVSSGYVLKNNQLSFKTGNYSGTLVIDPALEWATYYGGTGFIELSTGLVCDGAAAVYMSGVTTSTNNIATTGAFQATMGGGFFDGYLVKLDANGVRKWATYYGGSDDELTWGIACDRNANIYLSGSTPSNTNIATPGSYQATKTGSGSAQFLVRFDSSGVRKWGTYYGTTGAGIGLCAVDNRGGVYLAGTTTSNAANLATPGAFQTTYGGGGGDALLVKFDTAGARQWATFFGSDSLESMTGLVCDVAGNVFISGSTQSLTNIATTGAHQTVYGGNTDQYLVKFDDAGARKWSTYYGGSGNDYDGETNVLGADKAGNIYMTGRTSSTNGIASATGFQQTNMGNLDAFLVKFDGSGARQWGTYYGGAAADVGAAITTNNDGETLLAGYTASAGNIATTDGYQPAYGGGQYDAYVVRFDPDGQRVWGTYFGHTGSDAGLGVAFAPQGVLYLSGTTSSNNGISTPGSHQPVIGGSSSSFIAKFCIATIPVGNTVTGDDSICVHTTHTYSITPVAGATGYVWSFPSGWTGSSTTNTITLTAGTNGGLVRVRIIKCADTSAPQSLNVSINPLIPAAIVASGVNLSSFNTFTSYQWLFNGLPIAGATGATYTATQNGNYQLIGTSNMGCIDTSAVHTISGLAVQHTGTVANSIQLYPNPANSTVHIQSPVAVDILITGMDGKTVLQQRNATNINISELARGVYSVGFRTTDGLLVKTEKLVVY